MIYDKTKIKKEQVEQAPPVKVVWTNFCNWVNQFNYKKNKWDAPVAAGFNINNYDMKIVDRLCGKDPYKFGPYDDEYQCNALFNPVFKIDLMDVVFLYFESLKTPKSLSFDSLRQFFGMTSEAAHNAVFDTEQTAELLIRFLKLTRTISGKTKFEGACAKV